MSLSPRERQAFKAKAHSLKPVIIVGANGISDALIAEAEHAITAHELIKIKIAGAERDERKAMAEQLAQRLNAEFIQLLGNIVTLYRENLDD